ncbi:MAG TPA: alpha/beta hydrolase [Cytophagales bacterium]|nr:alpha/beta hydrolase [Cytophagales bacterium]
MQSPSPTQWHSQGQSFSFQNHKIFFRQENDKAKETILLLHGFPTASWDWHRVWPGLAEGYRLVAPDFLGFGFSDKPKRHAYSIRQQADICESLLRKLEVNRVHLLAHDYGNTVAQELLARHEDRKTAGDDSLVIQSCCFLNGGLFPETHRPKPIQKLLISPLGPLLTPFVGKSAMARTFRQIFGPDTQPTEEEMDAYWELVALQEGNKVMPRLIRYMTERTQNRERWVGAMQSTTLPMRIIDGVVDPISGEHMVQRYEALIPNPDVVRLPGIGHYPQMEAPEEVLKHVLEFLKHQGG